MAILLALLSAASYGTSDFLAGLASRRATAGQVAVVTQSMGVAMALGAILLFGGVGVRTRPIEWGAISGIGSTIGTMALYHGLAIGRMTVVATLAGVLTAAIPAAVGILLGNHLSAVSGAGILIAIPAIALVSWHPGARGEHDVRRELSLGAVAGGGFALMFITIAQAGTRSGAWPILAGQLVSLLGVLPFALRGRRTGARPDRRTLLLMILAGAGSAAANLLFLAASGRGQLAIVAVISALYPAGTVVAARIGLRERWRAIRSSACSSPPSRLRWSPPADPAGQ